MYWKNVENEYDWNNIDALEYRDDTEQIQPTVYFDMDGTLCKFNKNATMEEVFSPGYFRELDPFPNMILLAEELQNMGYRVCILSKSSYSAISEKEEWLKEWMPFIPEENIYFVPLERDKEEFVNTSSPLNVLIDDYWKNIQPEVWHHGVVKCVNDINSPDLSIPNVSIYHAPEDNTPKILNAFLWEIAKADKEEYVHCESGWVRAYGLCLLLRYSGLSIEDFISRGEQAGVPMQKYQLKYDFPNTTLDEVTLETSEDCDYGYED